MIGKNMRIGLLWMVLLTMLLSACSGILPQGNATPTPESPTDEPEEFIFGEAQVEKIDIRILESFPVQVHVGVTGYVGDGCTEINEILQNRDQNNFVITITTKRPAEAVCTLNLVGFEENIPLDVAGLPAGEYTVSVNGVTGTFELAVDNVLQ